MSLERLACEFWRLSSPYSIEAREEWKDLSTGQKWGIVLSATVQFALLTGALVDIYRRPKDEIRGNKILWTLASFVNFIGPASYFVLGRKR